MIPAELRKLASLAEQGKIRDLANYSQACKNLDDLQVQIDTLHADKRRYDLSNGDDPGTFARWQRWNEAKISELRSQHKEVTNNIELARLAAVKSLAKVHALEILLKKSLKEEVLVKRRRAEQNGQAPDA